MSSCDLCLESNEDKDYYSLCKRCYERIKAYESKDVSDEETNEAKQRVIGALAQDIRGSWGSGVSSRLNLIKRLGGTVTAEDYREASQDGRYMRDSWEGPYGMTSMKDLELLNLDPGIFEHPEQVIEDY